MTLPLISLLVVALIWFIMALSERSYSSPGFWHNLLIALAILFLFGLLK